MGAPFSSFIVITGHRWPMSKTNFPMSIRFWNTSSQFELCPSTFITRWFFTQSPWRRSLSLSLTCVHCTYKHTHTQKEWVTMCAIHLCPQFSVYHKWYTGAWLLLPSGSHHEKLLTTNHDVPAHTYLFECFVATQAYNPRNVHIFCLYLFHPVSGSALISTSVYFLSILHHSQQALVS